MGLEFCPQSHQNEEHWAMEREVRNGRQGDSFDRKHPERRIAMEIEKQGDKLGTDKETSMETNGRQEESFAIEHHEEYPVPRSTQEEEQ